MKTIDIVINNYKFLNDLYNLTKNDSISLLDSKLKQYKSKIVKYQENLKIFDIYDEHEKTITWKANAPTIEIAYNFYYSIAKKSKTFLDVKKVLENPENYKQSELLEAIEFNTFYKNETGKSFLNYSKEIASIENHETNLVDDMKPMTTMEINELLKTTTINNQTKTIFSPEYKELTTENLKLKKESQELKTENLFLKEEKKILEKSLPLKSQNNENDDLKIIIQYLGEIGKKTIEICDDTSKIEAVQGSFRKVIGMLTFVQKNQILQAKILNAIVVELQYDLNGTNIHESINNRRENLINAVMNVKELNQYNDANAHYINGK